MTGHLQALCFAALEPQRLADLWAAVLGWVVDPEPSDPPYLDGPRGLAAWSRAGVLAWLRVDPGGNV